MNQQSTQISVLLNLVGDFSIEELTPIVFKPISQTYFNQMKGGQSYLQADLFTYDQIQQKFIQLSFILLPNILLVLINGNALHLILSNCSIIKRKVLYNESEILGLALSDQIGNTFLFFEEPNEFRIWYKQMKQYCKLSGFLSKYQLIDKMCPGFFQCQKIKSKEMFTVQIYRVQDIETIPELLEAVHNEVHILRSIRHQSLLELKRFYEDANYLFIVYESYSGESLFRHLNNGLKLHEIQIASIIYQTLQLVKFLGQHSFYHGAINPANILINTRNSLLQITVINLSFKEYKLYNSMNWIMSRQPEQFIAPEILEGIAPTISSDIYSIGVLLYFVSFYTPIKPNDEDNDFFEAMETFQISMDKVYQLEQHLSRGGFQQLDYQNIGASQVDLMKKLIEPKPKLRLGLNETTKHTWFQNVKTKIKSMKVERKRKQPLPSLRTIIELREQSEMELKLSYQYKELTTPKTPMQTPKGIKRYQSQLFEEIPETEECIKINIYYKKLVENEKLNFLGVVGMQTLRSQTLSAFQNNKI